MGCKKYSLQDGKILSVCASQSTIPLCGASDATCIKSTSGIVSLECRKEGSYLLWQAYNAIIDHRTIQLHLLIIILLVFHWNSLTQVISLMKESFVCATHLSLNRVDLINLNHRLILLCHGLVDELGSGNDRVNIVTHI